MVAHNVADVSFVFAVMVRRRLFFQEDPSIVFLTVKLFIAPRDEVAAEPCFVVATLASRADTKSFMVNGECDSGGLRNPQTSAHVPGIDPRLHNGVGPGSIGKAQSAKASSMMHNIVAVVASPCSPVEVTGHQVHVFFKHHCTDRKDKLLSCAAFLGVNATDVQRQNSEIFGRWEVVDDKRHVIARP